MIYKLQIYIVLPYTFSKKSDFIGHLIKNYEPYVMEAYQNNYKTAAEKMYKTS